MNKAKDLIKEYLDLVREEDLTKTDDRMAFRDIKDRQDKIKEEIADILTLKEALKIVNYHLETEDGVYNCQYCKKDYQEEKDPFMEVTERKLELEEV